MGSKEQRWKNNEKQWAETLQRFGIPAFRKTQRIANFSISEDDVGVKGEPWIISDCKYKKTGFVTSKLLYIVQEKYVKNKVDQAIVITKGFRQVGQHCTVEADFLAGLLSVFLGLKTRQEIEELWKK